MQGPGRPHRRRRGQIAGRQPIDERDQLPGEDPGATEGKPPRGGSPTLLVVGVYLVVGVLWILFSDRLLPEHQTLKGLLFVLGTSALIWVLMDRSWKQRLEIEDRHRRTQRLEAIGRLAGGIAHDFNNIITAIRGYTDLLLARSTPGSTERADLEQIRAASDRAVSLTRQLLAFSRRGPLEPATLDLNDVVLSTLRLAERLLPSSIEIVNSLDEDLGPVRGDPAQLEQVLMNVLVNARDALGEAGHVRISTAAVTIEGDADHPGRVHIPPGDYALLRVSDDGPGMDRKTLDSMFEPFFTTKRGAMGLGLSTCYGIVKQHGGYIVATSEPGKGTTVHAYLPVTVETPHRELAHGRSPATSEAVAPAGSGRVLVVDDDLGTRSVVVRILRDAGYQVSETGRPRVAVELLERHGDDLDLVITDLVMPDLDGEELVDHIEHACPHAAILLITGDAGRATAGGARDHPLLEKPLDTATLRREVRALLSRSRPRQRAG